MLIFPFIFTFLYTWLNQLDRDDGLLSTFPLIAFPSQLGIWRENWNYGVGAYNLFGIEPQFLVIHWDRRISTKYLYIKFRLIIVLLFILYQFRTKKLLQQLIKSLIFILVMLKTWIYNTLIAWHRCWRILFLLMELMILSQDIFQMQKTILFFSTSMLIKVRN